MKKNDLNRIIKQTEDMISEYKKGLKWYKERLRDLKEQAEDEGVLDIRGKQIGYVIRGDTRVPIYEDVLRDFKEAETVGDQKRVIQKYYGYEKLSSIKSACWNYKQAVLGNRRYRRVKK